jgi:hypothetical protein
MRSRREGREAAGLSTPGMLIRDFDFSAQEIPRR